MDSTNDLSLQVLIEIRNDMRGLREAQEQTTRELAQTRQDLGRRIDQTNRQLVTTEIRLATEISALRAAIADERRPDLEERLSQCERDIEELRAAQK